MLLGVLAAMALLATALGPRLVRSLIQHVNAREQRRLAELGDGLLRSIERTQTIPGTNEWVATVATLTGMSTNEILQVIPEFPNDASTRRVYLLDPAFTPATGAGFLPYTQTSLGIATNSANAPGLSTRVMLVSSTRRNLTLAVSNGVATASTFSNLWEWRCDPATQAPPPGWPAAWAGLGENLHVERLNLANQFHEVRLRNLRYSINDSFPLESVTSEVQRYFLRGSLLKVFRTSGALYASRVVNRDCRFDLTVPTGPLLYYKLNEASGTLATNSGLLGSTTNGTYVNGPTLAQPGPGPPSFPGFPTGNNAVSFDGNNDYLDTSLQLPTVLTEFTLAGWVKPLAKLTPNQGVFGQRAVLWIESKNDNFLELITPTSGSLAVPWGYPANEWHHVTGIGDGNNLRVYYDGVLAATKAYPTANYGNPASTDPFRIGGRVNSTSDYSKMVIDEVVFYDRALSASEVSQLFNGTVP